MLFHLLLSKNLKIRSDRSSWHSREPLIPLLDCKVTGTGQKYPYMYKTLFKFTEGHMAYSGLSY
ncbi:Hypothetical protein PAS_chr2-1_0013 [Komagataella phaffii GS115]|uniref:Uncharacterized protein n=1 Tax=Komagataella phaffii (strain GS115 / ATCC 20864) TaxID=644223 RepID=C4QZD8_KOMPG|nr:Hypothetical protein PAS_chr2-1_0013 [Komagataella phaffii GS115]CAY68612.1 Hypothetical protein PAS_chr2-1_0013 [Komagataella phaffii GS115]